MMNWIYRWLPRIFGRHCRSSRSFYYKGYKFPICARCTGELTGIILSFILFWFWKPKVIISILIMLPLILDGSLQALTSYESNNIRRFVTGILFGIGLVSIFVWTTTLVFNLGIEYGKGMNM